MLAPVSPLDRGPLAQRRAVAVIELILCSSVPTQLVLQGLLILAGWKPTGPDGGFALGFVVTMSLADTVLLIALMVLLTRAHGDSLSQLWIGRRPIAGEVLLGIALVPVVFMLVVVMLNAVRMLLPSLHNVPTNPLEQLARGGIADAVAFALVAILAGGVREELQRAFMLRRFDLLGGERVGDRRAQRRLWSRSRGAGVGCGDRDWRARRVLGGALRTAAQQRGTARQPRRLQFAGSAASGTIDRQSVEGRSKDRPLRQIKHARVDH
jgi:hypothetical protein